MSFEYKSYGGKIFRPKPTIIIDENETYAIIATPWGQKDSADTAVNKLNELFTSSLMDIDITSPFSKLTCLSTDGNNLRTAFLILNDFVYHNQNKIEYSSGLEICMIVKSDTEITWISIGHPHLLMDRGPLFLQNIFSPIDLSLEMKVKKPYLPPLPKELLGIYDTSNFQVHSFSIKPMDKLFLISRTYIPGEVYNLDPKNRNISTISKILSKESEDEPFWIGEWKF